MRKYFVIFELLPLRLAVAVQIFKKYYIPHQFPQFCAPQNGSKNYFHAKMVEKMSSPSPNSSGAWMSIFDRPGWFWFFGFWAKWWPICGQKWQFLHRDEKKWARKRFIFFVLTCLEAPKCSALINNTIVGILPSQNFDLLPMGLAVVVQIFKNATFHTNFHSFMCPKMGRKSFPCKNDRKMSSSSPN